jgi:glycerol-3-phosphate dehydrogenase
VSEFHCAAAWHTQLKQDDGTLKASWSDAIDSLTYRSSARLVVNCAGPWAPDFVSGSANSSGARFDSLVRFSRGSHYRSEQALAIGSQRMGISESAPGSSGRMNGTSVP